MTDCFDCGEPVFSATPLPEKFVCNVCMSARRRVEELE